jgi:hypothetical protein
VRILRDPTITLDHPNAAMIALMIPRPPIPHPDLGSDAVAGGRRRRSERRGRFLRRS